MKNPFKAVKKSGQQTLQEMQQEFNQLLFKLGDANYRKSMFKAEFAKLDSEINTLTQNLDTLGKNAVAARSKAEEEVKATIAKGPADAPKAE